MLTVDFDFATSLPSIDDSFYISLLNQDFELYDLLLAGDFGLGNNLLSLVINTEDLLSNFVNQDWSLSFYLYDEVFDDNSTAAVSIHSVSLEKVVPSVPEPGTFALFALGCLGLAGRRQRQTLFNVVAK